VSFDREKSSEGSLSLTPKPDRSKVTKSVNPPRAIVRPENLASVFTFVVRLGKDNSVTFLSLQVTPCQGIEHPELVEHGKHPAFQFVKDEFDLRMPFMKPIKYPASFASVLPPFVRCISAAISTNKKLSTATMIPGNHQAIVRLLTLVREGLA